MQCKVSDGDHKVQKNDLEERFPNRKLKIKLQESRAENKRLGRRLSAHLAAANRPKLKAIETKKVKEYPQGQFKSALQLLESCGSRG